MEYCQTYIKVGEIDPEQAYLAVRGANTYLLESVEGGEKLARYSFIGFNPAAKMTYKDGLDFQRIDRGFAAKPEGEDPLQMLESLVSQYQLHGPTLARFAGGFVGYLSYDIVRHYIDLKDKPDELKQPDLELILTKNNIIFDHKTKSTYLIENHFTDPSGIDVEESIGSLEEIAQKLNDNNQQPKTDHTSTDPSSNFTQHEFEEAVRTCKNYIREGDAFQIVLSQRLSQQYNGDKFPVYQRLMKTNPSPYMYYLDFGKRVLVGSSPETLTRVEKNTVTTYPIAGTRKRGTTPAKDLQMERELLNDEKEKAEHLMLVDLGRNDVGRVAEYGSVKVTKFMEVERYSHVMHLSSEVMGKLRADKTEFDALKSIFPAGTVSGAPKVRAMEIINELEPTKRGIYAGSVGYFSFTRALDTAITIRTIVFEGDTAYVQAGAGIVADSKPELEYKETINKAKALLNVLEGEK